MKEGGREGGREGEREGGEGRTGRARFPSPQQLFERQQYRACHRRGSQMSRVVVLPLEWHEAGLREREGREGGRDGVSEMENV